MTGAAHDAVANMADTLTGGLVSWQRNFVVWVYTALT
jgi:hypothetical protein